ncbi:MAG: GAF domain-containing protein [Candidatus Sulfotelmatobacter sp.]
MNDLRLGAARKRLAESRGQEDAIDGVREIMGNFLGSEELGLFRVDRGSGTFHVFWSFGIDLEEYDLLRALGDAGLDRVMRGECHVELTAEEGGDEMGRARAFVPIRVANETVAILAILRLLPQKLDFDNADMELFKLLSDEAAKPLFGPGTSGQDGSGTGGSGTDRSGTKPDSQPVTEGPGIGA